MSAVLERCIAAKSRAQVAPVTPPHWRREIQGDAGRYDGAFSYALPGAAKTLEIAETAASTGTKVWDCAVALSRMFERHQHTSSRLAIRPNERVLELGGGSGLLALALAALGADVTTTDAAPVVPHLRKTIDANADSVPRMPTVAALDWRDDVVEGVRARHRRTTRQSVVSARRPQINGRRAPRPLHALLLHAACLQFLL